MGAYVRADAVKPGDLLDLEGDAYADAQGDNQWYPYEYAEVLFVDRESPTCVALGGDAWWVGFPPEHLLKLGD